MIAIAYHGRIVRSSSHHHLILFHLNVLNHHISSLHFFSAHSSSVTSLFFPSICSLPPTCFRATLSSSCCGGDPVLVTCWNAVTDQDRWSVNFQSLEQHFGLLMFVLWQARYEELLRSSKVTQSLVSVFLRYLVVFFGASMAACR